MNLLAIDCSSVSASAALFSNNRYIDEIFSSSAETHSVTLLPMIQTLIARNHLKPEEINYYAISHGPGSFTGLRIGVAMIKGLAFPNKTPCIGVSTLEALAMGQNNGLIAAVLDARRDQIYGALFRKDGSFLQRLTPDEGIAIQDFEQLLLPYRDTITLCGDGAVLVHQSLAGSSLSIQLAPNETRLCHARFVGELAKQYVCKSVGPEELVPHYLRPVHAITLQERQEKRDLL